MKLKNTVSVIFSVLNLFSAVVAVILSFSLGWKVNGAELRGFECFRGYAYSAAVFSGLISVLFLFLFIAVSIKKQKMPKWFFRLTYAAAVSVALSLSYAIFIVFPSFGYMKLISGVDLYVYLFCPIFTLVSFVALAKGKNISLKKSYIGAVPSVFYSIVYFLSIVLGSEDIYSIYSGKSIFSYMAGIAATVIASYAVSYVFFSFCRNDS